MTVFFNSGGDNAPRQAMPFGLYDITYQLIKPQDKDKTKKKNIQNKILRRFDRKGESAPIRQSGKSH